MKDGYGYGIRPCFPLVGKWTGGIQGNQKYTKPWLKVLLLPLLLLLYSIKIERCVIACAALKRRGVSRLQFTTFQAFSLLTSASLCEYWYISGLVSNVKTYLRFTFH